MKFIYSFQILIHSDPPGACHKLVKCILYCTFIYFLFSVVCAYLHNVHGLHPSSVLHLFSCMLNTSFVMATLIIFCNSSVASSYLQKNILCTWGCICTLGCVHTGNLLPTGKLKVLLETPQPTSGYISTAMFEDMFVTMLGNMLALRGNLVRPSTLDLCRLTAVVVGVGLCVSAHISPQHYLIHTRATNISPNSFTNMSSTICCWTT